MEILGQFSAEIDRQREAERRVAGKELVLRAQVNAVLANAIGEAARHGADHVDFDALRIAAESNLRDSREAIRFLDELLPRKAAAKSVPVQPTVGAGYEIE